MHHKLRSISVVEMYHSIICFALGFVAIVADSGNDCYLYVMIFSSKIVAATIEPDSLNVSLNSIATFTCSSFGANFLYFTIDGVPVTESVNDNRGLNEGSQEVINGTRYRSLTAEAKVINNNTNISCSRLPGEIIAEPALLRIQGSRQCNVSI